MAAKNRVTVSIFGEQYVVKTSGTSAYVKKLASVVDERMKSLAERHPQLGTAKVAVLTALSLADDAARASDPGDQPE